MDTVSTSATPDVQAVEGFERTSVTPDVQVVVSPRKMRWDKAIRNLIHIRGEEGVKKVFPFVDQRHGCRQLAATTKNEILKSFCWKALIHSDWLREYP